MMTQTVYLVTLKYDFSAKIVLTRLFTMLNESRKARGLAEFSSSKISLGHIEASAGSLEVELAYYASDVPPQVTICVSDSSDTQGATQLELAILTQYIVKTQPVEIIDWPLNHSQLTPQEFSHYLMMIVREAVDVLKDDGETGENAATIESLFCKHFPIKRVAPKHPDHSDRKARSKRPEPGFHNDYIRSILTNVEDGPVAAANSAVRTMEHHPAAYRLAAWALSFVVALFFWPLALPLIANNLRNGENLRVSAMAIGVVGLFTTLGLTAL